MDSYGLMSLEREREKINSLLFSLESRYLNDLSLRNKFAKEQRKFSLSYIDDYKRGRVTFGQAMENLIQQYRMLQENNMKLQMGKIRLYVIAQREEQRHAISTIVLKDVGFIGGVMQSIGGVGICKLNLGAACKTYGAALLLHGTENMWENGYYLVTHEEPNLMPLRNVYRSIAGLLGGTVKNGDIAFSVGDIGLSVGSASMLTLKPEAWKLLYYIREDYIRSWRTLSVAEGVNEVVGDSSSSFSIYQLMGRSDTEWAELKDE
ncbi:MAG TPA: DUF4225 domain-containing protein [Scandinavium sp.]|jgi:hypothetical protein|uniref:DUF4225 domain-containing protein n=1 Tax=Scandinavium sp. TaxID=2830653 RepID=UPI002E37AE99|nr:DUF4225 domain-containing protein [Scandinavium sp.]HEX4502004.1 DUF4225 domain-containing protein [Scandinavium sp.]